MAAKSDSMRPLPWVLVALLALATVGCSTIAPTLPAPSRPGFTARPSTSWLAAESWEGFTRDLLWPQEWALRHWHAWKVVSGHLELVPVAPLPPTPVASARDMGDDPRVWRLEYFGGAAEAEQGTFARELTFSTAESGVLGPSTYAFQKILMAEESPSVQARVLSVTYGQGRFTVKLALR